MCLRVCIGAALLVGLLHCWGEARIGVSLSWVRTVKDCLQATPPSRVDIQPVIGYSLRKIGVLSTVLSAVESSAPWLVSSGWSGWSGWSLG